MGCFGSYGLVQKSINDLRLCPVIKTDPDPVLPLHSDRSREVRSSEESYAAAAFQVAALDLCTGIGIPLAHEKGDPFSGLRVAEDGKAREVRPFVLFLHMIFLSGIRRKL